MADMNCLMRVETTQQLGATTAVQLIVTGPGRKRETSALLRRRTGASELIWCKVAINLLSLYATVCTWVVIWIKLQHFANMVIVCWVKGIKQCFVQYLTLCCEAGGSWMIKQKSELRQVRLNNYTGTWFVKCDWNLQPTICLYFLFLLKFVGSGGQFKTLRLVFHAVCTLPRAQQ